MKESTPVQTNVVDRAVEDIRKNRARAFIFITPGAITDFTEGQRGCLAIEVIDLFEAEAKEDGQVGWRPRSKLALRALMPNDPKLSGLGRARHITGSIFGVGARTIDRARAMKKHLPELFESVKRGERRISDQGVPPQKITAWGLLERLAAERFTSHQIAQRLGVARQTVMEQAKRRGVMFPADNAMRKSKQSVNSNRVLSDFASTLEALAPSCDLIQPEALNAAVLSESVKVMSDALKQINRLVRNLKKTGNGI